MQPIVVSIGKADHLAQIVSVKEFDWNDFARRLTQEPPVSEDKASAGWYCPARFSPEYRDSENFVARYALTFDFDKIERSDVAVIEQIYRDYAYVMYTTASHTKEHPRIRMVFPLSRPATLDEFCAVTRKHGARFDLEKLARESDTPAQMMFLPTRKSSGTFRAKVNEGKWVDVDSVLGEYDDWTNRELWPKRLRGDSVHVTGEGITPPDEKPGIVGDFCRAFRVPEAISRFELPYTPGSGDRFTYTAGSRPDGLRIYDDGLKAHSEHDTDPARGQNNAFDLVRLHKFGALDTEEDLAKSVVERPSYRAMVKFAMEQPELQAASVAGEFVDLGPLPAEQPTGSEADAQQTPLALARPLADVLAHPTIPRWLLRDRLERGVIAVMAGPRGSYKSFIGVDWTMEVATDLNLPAYVISAEGADYDRRSLAWLKAKSNSTKPSEVPIFVVERRLDLNEKNNIELIRQDCLRLGIRPALFVLDTFSKLSGGLDENSNSDVKAFIGRLDNGLKRAFDATVLLIAHTGHTDKGRVRGASALEADTDAAYIVTRNDNLKNVAVSRQRFKSSPELDHLWLAPQIVNLGYEDADGEPVTSLVMQPAEPPTQGGRGSMTKKQKIAMEIITSALAGQEQGRLPTDAIMQMLVDSAAKPLKGRDTRPQAAKRMVETLAGEKLIVLKNGFVQLHAAEAADWE